MTGEEQQRCLHAANGCWRANHPANRQNGRNGHKPDCSAGDNGRDEPDEIASDDFAEGQNGRGGRSKAKKKGELAREA